jgi:signal transduction histidine kinase
VAFYVAGALSYIAHDYMFCSGPIAACHTIGSVVVPPNQGPGLSREVIGIYIVVRDTLFSLGFWVVAAFLFWRRADDRVALLAAVGLGCFPLAFNIGFISTLASPWWFIATLVSFLGSVCFKLFVLIFPDGRFVPRWMSLIFVVIVLFLTLNTFFPTASLNPSSHSPWFGNLFLFAQIATFIGVQIYRYRWVSTPAQRQQNKWIVYGISVGWGGYLAHLILSLLFPVLTETGPLIAAIASALVYGLLLLIPLSIGFAVLRSRLWDIDVVINRTVVYGILTVCVVGLYVLVVGSLGAIFGVSGNLLISLGATALVAMLFQPLRAWLQRAVNRLLYGLRDEPYAVITQLSQRLETTLAPDAVESTIVETVAQALKLPYVAILVKQEEKLILAASVGEPVSEPLCLPLIYQAETIGQLHLAPRAPGESFTPADRRLLDELARQAGQAAHTAQLATDLQRSHERLEQRVAERTRELSSLLEISRTVASTLQLKPLLGLILDELKTVVDYADASVLVVEGDDLVFLDHRGSAAAEPMMQPRVPLERWGLIWQAIVAGDPTLIENIHAETQPAEALRTAIGAHWAASAPAPYSWIIVPLRLRDRVSGLLALNAYKENAFTAHHATLALAVANQAAVAIENARLYEQAQELAALEERQKLARELHDSVSQALYGIALGLHTARIQLDRDPEELPESLDYLLSLAEAALAEMRALIFELRPESLEHEGLIAALSRQAAALQARHNIAVHTDLCEEPSLAPTAKQELYRIAQEAVQNAVKHAHADNVDLLLRQSASAVILEVRDDGIGFDPEGLYPGHLGLRSMRERAQHINGALWIESAPDQGTRLVAEVPCSQPPVNAAAAPQLSEPSARQVL